MDEEYKTAFTKVDGFYKELHSINTELKEITEHNAVITNPNQKRQISIIADLNLFQKQISYIIETVNKLEDNCGLKKFEFDMKKSCPLESLDSSCILEKCHQIQSFFEEYDLAIIKIKLNNCIITKDFEKEEKKQFQVHLLCRKQ